MFAHRQGVPYAEMSSALAAQETLLGRNSTGVAAATMFI